MPKQVQESMQSIFLAIQCVVAFLSIVFHQYSIFQLFNILQELLTKLFVLFVIRCAMKDKRAKPEKSQSSCCVSECKATGYCVS